MNVPKPSDQAVMPPALTQPAPVSNGCPVTPFSHQSDAADSYVALPSPVPGETVQDVLLPGGKPVGCENPRFRLVHGTEQDAQALFDRLTKSDPKGYITASAATRGNFRANGASYSLVQELRIRRSDGMAVGLRPHFGCRRPLLWIVQWPGEGTQSPGVKPVLLEFADAAMEQSCKPRGYGDADGGGP